MSENWQAGDLALCTYSFRVGFPQCVKPRAGQVCTVTAVTQGRTHKGLVLAECPTVNRLGWRASAFRKIHPHKPDAEDRETIALLNGQPVGEPA